MFCKKCGTEIPEDASFCPKCGLSLENKAADVSENKSSVEQDNSAKAKPKSKKKWIIGGAIGVVVIVIAVIFVLLVGGIIIGVVVKNNANNKKVADIEDKIYAVDLYNIYDNEDEILSIYDEYLSLPQKLQRNVQNRSDLINAYNQVEALIETRKADAAVIEQMIENIDYSNSFAEMSSVRNTVIAFNGLDDKTKKYVENKDILEAEYNKVSAYQITIDDTNFWDFFNIEYVVYEKTNSGYTATYQSGYTFNYDTGKIYEDTTTKAHNDYSIPVEIVVYPLYEGLEWQCDFHIDLHQTYQGLGIIDSDTHEWDLQSGNISFQSSDEYFDGIIYVENNDASGGLLDLFGYSWDFSDLAHSMDDFDPSRVEVSNVYGVVTY